MDAVVGVDDDTTVLAAQLAAALGLPHNSVEAVKAARYKDVMRLALGEAEGVLSPAFWMLGTDDGSERVSPSACRTRACSSRCRWPPAAASSAPTTRGSSSTRSARSCRSWLRQTWMQPIRAPAQLLVEEFIPGAKVALEGLLIDGALTTLALFDKPDPLDGPYFEETIYVTPSRLPRRPRR